MEVRARFNIVPRPLPDLETVTVAKQKTEIFGPEGDPVRKQALHQGHAIQHVPSEQPKMRAENPGDREGPRLRQKNELTVETTPIVETRLDSGSRFPGTIR